MSKFVETTTSFLISDLSGYTALTETHGDFLAAKLLDRYTEIVYSIVKEDIILVDTIGDEVLLTSVYPQFLLEAAIDLQHITEQEPNFPSLHIGLHCGKVLERGGKYIGITLNLTSRISSHSRGGQILCSQDFKDVIENKENFSFIKLGNIRFKNVRKPVTVFELYLESDRKRLSVDPVCKMQVDIENPPEKIPFKDNTYYFCSYECTKLFIKSPDDFINFS